MTTGAHHRLAGVVLVLGGLSIALMLAVDTVRTRVAGEDVALLLATGHIPAGLATSHLWMEELISGDTVDQEAVWGGIRRALQVSAAMQGGAEALDGPWRVGRIDEPELRAALAELGRGLQRFSDLTRARQSAYERGEAVGAGTPTDRRYDDAFRALVKQAEDLQAAVERRLLRRQARINAYLYAVLAGWVAVVTIAFASLRRFENRRHETAVALRARDLQLVLAQKMEAVGRLAGGVAHDINNYLAAIRAQCELMLRKEVSPESRREKLTAAVSAVDKASTLIQRLLAFARRQPANPEIVDLNRVIVDLRPILEQHLGENVSIETHLEPRLGRVSIDPSQLEQILVNLIVNARDAMPQGGKLSITTAEETFGGVPGGHQPVSTPGDFVVMTVADSGAGIPPEMLDQIFEPFFTTKEGHGNSGLGLATVYGIVTQNGGAVRASNAANAQGGATFRVYLPRAADGEVAAERHTVPPPGAAAVRGHVLLVEDNADVRESTHGLLASAGYTVTTANDGPAGLAAGVANAAFDLVVTDVVMPGISGPDMVAKLRERQPFLPAVFISGCGDVMAGVQVAPHRTARVLQKPFSADQLFARIREALAESAPN